MGLPPLSIRISVEVASIILDELLPSLVFFVFFLSALNGPCGYDLVLSSSVGFLYIRNYVQVYDRAILRIVWTCGSLVFLF